MTLNFTQGVLESTKDWSMREEKVTAAASKMKMIVIEIHTIIPAKYLIKKIQQNERMHAPEYFHQINMSLINPSIPKRSKQIFHADFLRSFTIIIIGENAKPFLVRSFSPSTNMDSIDNNILIAIDYFFNGSSLYKKGC